MRSNTVQIFERQSIFRFFLSYRNCGDDNDMVDDCDENDDDDGQYISTNGLKT